jgi:hypothetical protein
MKYFLLLFYSIPFGVGLWWLILFTRPRVVAAFKSPVPGTSPAIDLSGFPQQPATPAPTAPTKPSCPVPLLVVAGLLLSSAVSTPILALLPTAPTIPFFFFGEIFYGSITKIVLIVVALFNGIAAIGLIRLKPLALDLILALQVVFLVNGVASVASPRFLVALHEVMGQVALSNPALPRNFPGFSDSFFRAMLCFGLIFSLGVIAVLLAYRSRFRNAAEASR